MKLIELSESLKDFLNPSGLTIEDFIRFSPKGISLADVLENILSMREMEQLHETIADLDVNEFIEKHLSPPAFI